MLGVVCLLCCKAKPFVDAGFEEHVKAQLSTDPTVRCTLLSGAVWHGLVA